MNYFEFFEIPECLSIDEVGLKQKFYANSKRFHPDFFTLDSTEKQAEALEMSTLNNTAYKVLSNFDKRLKYFLDIRKVLNEEGQNKLPQEFLMEMMEVNESLMELQFDFDQDSYEGLLGAIASSKASETALISSLLPKSSDEMTEDDLSTLKNYYLKSKYLIRLEQNLRKLRP